MVKELGFSYIARIGEQGSCELAAVRTRVRYGAYPSRIKFQLRSPSISFKYTPITHLLRD